MIIQNYVSYILFADRLIQNLQILPKQEDLPADLILGMGPGKKPSLVNQAQSFQKYLNTIHTLTYFEKGRKDWGNKKFPC